MTTTKSNLVREELQKRLSQERGVVMHTIRRSSPQAMQADRLAVIYLAPRCDVQVEDRVEQAEHAQPRTPSWTLEDTCGIGARKLVGFGMFSLGVVICGFPVWFAYAPKATSAVIEFMTLSDGKVGANWLEFTLLLVWIVVGMALWAFGVSLAWPVPPDTTHWTYAPRGEQPTELSVIPPSVPIVQSHARARVRVWQPGTPRITHCS